jgi:uncharacterized protein
MPATQLLLGAVLAIFIGALVQSTIGFGSALIAMPLLSAALGLQQATAVFGVLSLVMSVFVLLIDRRQILLRDTWRLTLAAILGVPVGLLVLRLAPEALVMRGLGVILIGYGLFGLFSARLTLRAADWVVWPFGFVSGILGGAYNTNGPPLVVYGTLQGWDPRKFRATLQSVFFTSGIAIAAGHALAGMWTSQVLLLTIIGAPGLLLAAAIGRWLNRRINHAVFRVTVYCALIGLGATLALRSA